MNIPISVKQTGLLEVLLNVATVLIITNGYCEERLMLNGREHAHLIPEGAKLPFVPKGKLFRVAASRDQSAKDADTQCKGSRYFTAKTDLPRENPPRL